jgi:hypothetical protein
MATQLIGSLLLDSRSYGPAQANLPRRAAFIYGIKGIAAAFFKGTDGEKLQIETIWSFFRGVPSMGGN